MNSGYFIFIVSSVWFLSEFFLARTKRSLPSDKQEDKSSLRTIWTTIILSVNAGVFMGIQRLGHIELQNALMPFVGYIFIICGLIIRWTAVLTLKRQFTVDVSIRSGHKIISHGIYRIIRHPSYLGTILSFLGLGIYFSNYISIIVIALPITIVFLYRISIEEQALIQSFGDEYRDYCKTTRRLIPRIY